MHMRAITRTTSIAVLVILGLALTAWAAESPKPTTPTDLDKLVGQPVDLSPWAYAWRADRQVQEKPEAYFIPRWLEQIDKVLRPKTDALPDQFQPMDAWLEHLDKGLRPKTIKLPPPKGRLCAGLLWLGPTRFRRVELHWPADGAEPPTDAIEVRTYVSIPGSSFGVRFDVTMDPPKVSEDRRIWEYLPRNNPEHERFTGMVAVFLDESKLRTGQKSVVPQVRLIGEQVWKQMNLDIEWGLQSGTEKAVFDGDLESWVGVVSKVAPLPEDKGTTLAGELGWRSTYAADSGRRGVTLSLGYVPRVEKGPLWDTRITLRTKNGSFTFLPADLNRGGAIIVPELGFVVTQTGSGKTGRQWMEQWAAKNAKCLPQMIREHAEFASWDELMRKIRFAPDLTNLPPLQPFPEEVPPTAMRVQLPDERWNDAWRRSSWQLSIGNGGYWDLALEAPRPIYAMDMVGLHETSGRRLDYWLKSRGAMANGDFVDGEGSLQHGAGKSYDGIHPQTGWLLFALAERYLLSGDKEWFVKNRPRMQAAADWIVRQRKLYLKDMPNRETLEAAGLQPSQGIGDGTPWRWRWYLINDAFSLKGLRRFADALAEFDAPAAEKYQEEARSYTADLLRAVEREIVWSPVRPARDGAFYRWIPSSLYARGTMMREILKDYTLLDLEMGSLPLACIGGVLDPCDRRIAGHLNLVEDMLCPERNPKLDSTGAWFSSANLILLKYSFVGDVHLLRDDVPCFLRHWMIYYAASVQPDGSFPEWNFKLRNAKTWDSAGLRPYTEKKGPTMDLMNTGWFMENFRNLLVMEQDGTLWLARATPRAWLEHAKKISVKNAPTYFGTVAYEIVSDVDNGKISATVEMPARKAPKEVVLRFRHPKAAPIKAVTVNGKPWTEFNKDKETITLKGLTGQVAVTAHY